MSGISQLADVPIAAPLPETGEVVDVAPSDGGAADQAPPLLLPGTMSEQELAELLEINILLDTNYAPTGLKRGEYRDGIRAVAALLWKAKAGAEPGTAVLQQIKDAGERYQPSMLAIQLLLESNTRLHPDSAYFANMKKLDQPALDELVRRLHLNDVRLGDFEWYTPIALQSAFPHVYALLRTMILTDRRARDKVCITRVAEWRASNVLLKNGDLVAQLKQQEAAMEALATDTRANLLAKADAIVDTVIDFINKTLYDLFLDAVQPMPTAAPAVPAEDPFATLQTDDVNFD